MKIKDLIKSIKMMKKTTNNCTKLQLKNNKRNKN